jgi:hypothetical protein
MNHFMVIPLSLIACAARCGISITQEDWQSAISFPQTKDPARHANRVRMPWPKAAALQPVAGSGELEQLRRRLASDATAICLVADQGFKRRQLSA